MAPSQEPLSLEKSLLLGKVHSQVLGLGYRHLCGAEGIIWSVEPLKSVRLPHSVPVRFGELIKAQVVFKSILALTLSCIILHLLCMCAQSPDQPGICRGFVKPL